MPSSNTPESEPKQGPSDWSLETPSDDLLSPEVRRRIARLLLELAATGR